jgi:hypothetical protein
MRSLVACLMAGVLVVLAMDLIAPAGLAGARSASEHGVAIQSVDRTFKGDRLPMSTTVVKQLAPAKLPGPNTRPTVIVGCDPVFSPLAASARANFSGRCIA